MGELIKISKRLCKKCKYHCGADQKISCNYLACTGHSRIFKDGSMMYDPTFCDKYEKGAMLRPFREIDLTDRAQDEYDDYKCVKIRKEQATYEYKHKYGETQRRYRGNL